MFGARLIAVIFCICFAMSTVAEASNTVRIKARFSPNKLGASTSVLMTTDIGTTAGTVPSPVTSLDISLPQGVGLGNTTLGEALCSIKTLEFIGPSGCSPNSRMGFGHATVALPIGPEPVEDAAKISIFMGPPVNHHTSLLFYADSVSPVSAQLVFPGQLTETERHGHILTDIPLTPTLPAAPDASVVHMQTSLGPAHLTYYTHVHGKIVGYKPVGLAEPESCPRGGFPFVATYKFQDGSTVITSTVAPCPQAKSNNSRHRRSSRLKK
jgi:hypothetical protein